MVKLGNEWLFKENTVRFPAHNRHSLSDLCGQLRGWGLPAQNMRICICISHVEERKPRIKNLNFYTKSAFSVTTLKQTLTHVYNCETYCPGHSEPYATSLLRCLWRCLSWVGSLSDTSSAFEAWLLSERWIVWGWGREEQKREASSLRLLLIPWGI